MASKERRSAGVKLGGYGQIGKNDRSTFWPRCAPAGVHKQSAQMFAEAGDNVVDAAFGDWQMRK